MKYEMMLFQTRASSNTCPRQNLFSSSLSGQYCTKYIITHLNLKKSHHSHSHSHSLTLSTSLWRVMITTSNGNGWCCPAISAMGMMAAAVVLSTPPPSEETLSNIPQTLGQSCDSNTDDSSNECEGMTTLKKRIQKPKSRNAESCTSKCVTTCIRGGDGSPGEGPLNFRGPIVVFKQGFRSRQYCLVECSDICNLIDDADKGR